MGVGKGMAANSPIIAKVVELVFAIFCVGLIVHPFASRQMQIDMNHAALVHVTYSSCIIINTVIIISHVLGEFIPKRSMILFTMTGGVLFVAAASVIIDDWRNLSSRITLIPPKLFMDTMIASGVIAMFNGLIHFVDVGLTIKYTE